MKVSILEKEKKNIIGKVWMIERKNIDGTFSCTQDYNVISLKKITQDLFLLLFKCLFVSMATKNKIPFIWISNNIKGTNRLFI